MTDCLTLPWLQRGAYERDIYLANIEMCTKGASREWLSGAFMAVLSQYRGESYNNVRLRKNVMNHLFHLNTLFFSISTIVTCYINDDYMIFTLHT